MIRETGGVTVFPHAGPDTDSSTTGSRTKNGGGRVGDWAAARVGGAGDGGMRWAIHVNQRLASVATGRAR